MNPIRILHLEDSPNDVELVRAMLADRRIHCDVKRVETDADFIQAMEREKFDLILCDYNLPSFDGSSALGIARKKCPDVPFIFVSGTIGEERAIECLKIGATDYVLKDRLARLVPSIQRALRETGERMAHKQADLALRKSEERCRQLAENIHEVFSLTTPGMTEVIYVSPAYEKIWGRACESLCQSPKSWIEAVHPDDRERVALITTRVLHDAVEEEFRILRPDGALRPADPLFCPGGRGGTGGGPVETPGPGDRKNHPRYLSQIHRNYAASSGKPEERPGQSDPDAAGSDESLRERARRDAQRRKAAHDSARGAIWKNLVLPLTFRIFM